MKKIVVASSNVGKIKEIKAMLKDYEVIPYTDIIGEVDIEETGNTFLENAMIKAKTVSNLTGLSTLADDSGLSIDALNGEPGIYSARYSGNGSEANNDLVLEKMKNIEPRDAKFCCAMVFYRVDGEPITAYGETKGKILTERVGKNGFGYDPIFFSDELNMPMGLATPEQKNSVSHRSKALKSLISQIEKL